MTNLHQILDDERRRHRATLAFLTLSGSDLTGDNPVYRPAAAMVDDLAFLLGLVIESDPYATTPQQLRLRGEDIGKRVTAFARAIRNHNDETGAALISSFGVAESVDALPAGALTH